MHAPIVMVAALGVRALELPSWTYFPSVLFGIVLAVIGTYLFHLVFERPFMPRHLRRRMAEVLPGGDSKGL
jgi:peptidoglycan/LPS O-acetylase OafA/YrhL